MWDLKRFYVRARPTTNRNEIPPASRKNEPESSNTNRKDDQVTQSKMVGLWEPESGMPDLQGKIVVITGATSGIGLQTTIGLASRGAKVYLTARTPAKAAATINEILLKYSQISSVQLQWLELDLTSLESVLKAVQTLKEREEQIHLLINNAGEYYKEGEKMNSGRWDATLASCYIGHFVFTDGLLPLMKRAAIKPSSDVRIICVASNLQNSTPLLGCSPLHFDLPLLLAGSQPRSWLWRNLLRHIVTVDLPAYANAKLSIVIFAQELQRLLDDDNAHIIAMSVHPGAVCTTSALSVVNPCLRPLVRLALDDEEVGSHNILFAATAKEIAENSGKYKGNYLEPIGQVCPKHPVSENQELCRGLWEMTAKEVDHYLMDGGHDIVVD